MNLNPSRTKSHASELVANSLTTDVVLPGKKR